MATEPNELLVELQRPDGTWVQVGVVRKDQSYNEFRFLDSYFQLPNRPVLGYKFEFDGRDKVLRSRAALPHWFSHLLPEGRLLAAVARASGVSPAHEYQLLRRIGESDLPGALRVSNRAVDPLSWEGPIHEDLNLPVGDQDAAVLKFSLAGAQMKFSVSLVESALTIPVDGKAGSFILKLPDERPGFDSVPEAEHATMSFAKRVGLDVAETSVVKTSDVDGIGRWSSSDSAALLVERFDRRDGHRVHAEEFAQVLDIPVRPERAKYQRANFETVVAVALQLDGELAAYEVIKRIAFNALVGNGDAHLKNWGVLYPDGIIPKLSPAYDMVPTIAYIPDDDFGMNLGGQKSFELITMDSFSKMVTKVGLERAMVNESVLQVVESVDAGWTEFLEGFSRVHQDRLRDHRKILPLSMGV